jgi:hypothetical protein
LRRGAGSQRHEHYARVWASQAIDAMLIERSRECLATSRRILKQSERVLETADRVFTQEEHSTPVPAAGD